METHSEGKVKALHEAMSEIEATKVTAFHQPTLWVRIALSHGKRLDMERLIHQSIVFVREELGVLVDFLGDTLLEGENRINGLRGMPRGVKQK